MFESILNSYGNCGCFKFKPNQNLQIQCTAPVKYSGVYLIYDVSHNTKNLLYIGSSGQMKDGVLKTRKSGLGGMKDRLVNGYHPKFGKVRRKKAFPNQMISEDISEIEIKWCVTYDENHLDLPTEVERRIKGIYYEKFNCNPPWHK